MMLKSKQYGTLQGPNIYKNVIFIKEKIVSACIYRCDHKLFQYFSILLSIVRYLIYCEFQQMKESGGLKRMVALITDTPPPEEESKKADKKGGSRAGKKSAGGKDGGKYMNKKISNILLSFYFGVTNSVVCRVQ